MIEMRILRYCYSYMPVYEIVSVTIFIYTVIFLGYLKDLLIRVHPSDSRSTWISLDFCIHHLCCIFASHICERCSCIVVQQIICRLCIKRYKPQEILYILACENALTYIFICKLGNAQLRTKLCSYLLHCSGCTVKKILHCGLL